MGMPGSARPPNETNGLPDQVSRSVNDNTLNQSEYDFTYRVFPNDLNNDDIGHYMVININVPVFALSSSLSGATARTSYGGTQFNQTLFQSNNQWSKVDALRFGNAVDVGGLTPVLGMNALKTEMLSIPRFTRRIKESIAMFMPTPIVYNTTNEYQETSLTALAGGLITGAAGATAARFFGADVGAGVENLLSSAGKGLGKLSSLAGYPINPRVEVMFSKTNLRQFVFEFLMAPRNAEESETMKAIIRTLRYHAAPELDSVTEGFTWIPPAEFDITFYNRGKENTNIPRINTCVLDRIEVDYTPTGKYSTFSNGHPVAARLSLGMREIEVVHKRRVLQGF